jgi:hypothetical protein
MDIPLLSTPSSDIITHEIAQLERRVAEGDYSARLNDSLGNTKTQSLLPSTGCST